MASQGKVNTDKATVKQPYKAVVRAMDELNETSILYDPKNLLLPICFITRASDFHVPNPFETMFP